MPFMSKISTFSFSQNTFWSATGFMLVKNILLLINFLSMLAGIILICGGCYIQTQAPSDDLIGISSGIAVAAIVIGLIVSVVSFLGCFGAANEKGLLLKTYFAILILLIILELGVGIAGYTQRNGVVPLLETNWYQQVQNNNTLILTVEKSFGCCGFHNVTDSPLPTNCAAAYGYTQGCFSSLRDALQGSLSTIGGAGIVIGVIELVGLVFSVFLFIRIAAKEQATRGIMNDAWRINRNNIQYGFQNYQYV
ncbi:Tetraspanin family-domain-containing protein [Polychytrium aggregatum]|uniref:Tetraspanin family-domain-containing protein n=1 Tax=Polychytrium aggregatum TaxID=110093 RepID=UPI0022FE7274|nr:Tetraspanin family-domain-containing protein [Polychytrium aggregatum]KAI9193688.1 Tetraspanin family-domain-containing protein [Polychytrium aggregatum]